MRKSLLIFIIILSICRVTNGQDLPQDKMETMRQIDIYYQITDYLDSVFKEFSEGYLEADGALKKIIVIQNEYDKLAKPVPNTTKKLYGLVKELLSRVENYFIYFKRTNRENPEINVKIARTKIDLLKEVETIRLKYLL